MPAWNMNTELPWLEMSLSWRSACIQRTRYGYCQARPPRFVSFSLVTLISWNNDPVVGLWGPRSWRTAYQNRSIVWTKEGSPGRPNQYYLMRRSKKKKNSRSRKLKNIVMWLIFPLRFLAESAAQSIRVAYSVWRITWRITTRSGFTYFGTIPPLQVT